MHVAYLGQKGSFASLVAKQRYGTFELVAQPTIEALVEYVSADENRLGILPIENSSGGLIYDSIDAFVQDSFKLFIQEETSIQVRFALLGRKGEAIKIIYSHWAALKHCGDWIRQTFPAVKTQATSSTSEAARITREDASAAALATRETAGEFGLDILQFPVLEDVPNTTSFFTIGHHRAEVTHDANTSMVATISNRAGSLYEFLKPFHDLHVNMTRIQSRIIPGRRDACKFFIGLEGSDKDSNVSEALQQIKEMADHINVLGSYPKILEPYQS